MLQLKIVLVVFLFGNTCFAQCDSSLLQSEKAFAALALQKNIRTAFLKNLDSNGVIFHNGEVLEGLQQFAKAKENNIRLLWVPAFAATSASGDIGFTTGPFEVRKTLQSPVIQAGQYSSVWCRGSLGKWKLLVDLGIDYHASIFDSLMGSQLFCHLTAPKANNEWKQVEADFIEHFQKEGVACFERCLHQNTWVNIQGKHPLQSKESIVAALAGLPSDLSFTPLAMGAAEAGDLFYVYGNINYRSKKENYLRIWAHVPEGWKIILQVIKL